MPTNDLTHENTAQIAASPFCAQEGFAMLLTTKEYIQLWNDTYPDDKIEDEVELWEIVDDTDIHGFDNLNSISFTYDTSATWAKAAQQLGAFGYLINPDNYYAESTEWVYYAPTTMNYFRAAYKNLDDMINDIIDKCKLLKPHDYEFVRGHLVYVNIITKN